MTATHPFDHDESRKSKKWEVNAEMGENRLLLKINCYFNPNDSASSSKRLLADNNLQVRPQKRSLQKKSSAGIAEEIEILELDNLESDVASSENVSGNNEYRTMPW